MGKRESSKPTLFWDFPDFNLLQGFPVAAAAARAAEVAVSAARAAGANRSDQRGLKVVQIFIEIKLFKDILHFLGKVRILVILPWIEKVN